MPSSHYHWCLLIPIWQFLSLHPYAINDLLCSRTHSSSATILQCLSIFMKHFSPSWIYVHVYSSYVNVTQLQKIKGKATIYTKLSFILCTFIGAWKCHDNYCTVYKVMLRNYLDHLNLIVSQTVSKAVILFERWAIWPQAIHYQLNKHYQGAQFLVA